jgi:hypothetical protein
VTLSCCCGISRTTVNTPRHLGVAAGRHFTFPPCLLEALTRINILNRLAMRERTVILLDFAVYVGLILSRPEVQSRRRRVSYCQTAPRALSDVVWPSRHECHVRRPGRPSEEISS